jgi:NAD(P)H-dependent flavin oxidoreductase YrpB (nitropropane dioxygenase family)
MFRTRLTDLLGCSVPLQMAGMGQVSTPRLAAAVADAGGLGMVGVSGAPPEHVAKALDETRHLTSGVFGANFIVASLRDTPTGEIDAMPHWAGESVDAVKRVQPAGEIVREMAEEAQALLHQWRA